MKFLWNTFQNRKWYFFFWELIWKTSFICRSSCSNLIWERVMDFHKKSVTLYKIKDKIFLPLYACTMHVSHSPSLRTFRFKVKCQSIKIKTFVFPSTSSTHYNHKVKEKICMWVMWVMNREWLLCHSPQFDTFYQERTKWRNFILALYDMNPWCYVTG